MLVVASIAAKAVFADHPECDITKTVESSFNPEDLGKSSFESFKEVKGKYASIPWPQDVSDPIKFTLKHESDAGDDNFRAIVQIAMSPTDPLNSHLKDMLNVVFGKDRLDAESDYSPLLQRLFKDKQLFNCFIDRSPENPCRQGRENPRCCYSPSVLLDEMNRDYPECPIGCNRYGNTSEIGTTCRIVCFHALVIQVEFHRNKNFTGGKTAISAVFKKTSMLQRELNNVHQFTDIALQDSEATYIESTSTLGSTLNNKTAMGFWIRWIPSTEDTGPFLEVS